MSVYSPLLFHTLQLLGLMPFTVLQLPLGRQVLMFSRPLALYTYTLPGLFCSLFGLWIYDNFYSEASKEPHFWTNVLEDLSVMTFVVWYLADLAAALVCLLGTARRCARKIQLLEKLQEIDFQLQMRDPSTDNRLVNGLALVYFFILVLAEIFSEGFTWFSSNNMFIVHRFLSLNAVLEYAELVLNINEGFKLVNKRTLQVVKRIKFKQDVWTTALPSVETFAMPQEQSINIALIDQAHWNLCCLITDINDLYALQLIFITGQLFYSLIFSYYTIYLVFTFDFSLFRVLRLIGWIILFLVELFILALPCTITAAEAMKTKAVVAKLIGYDVGDIFKTKLENVLQQLFHREVRFSVAGLFTLETSTVLSVFGAVTTYLAIIVQFRKSLVQPSQLSNTTTAQH